MRKSILFLFLCGLFLGTGFGGGEVFAVNPRLAQLGRAYQFDGVDDKVSLKSSGVFDAQRVTFDFKATQSGVRQALLSGMFSDQGIIYLDTSGKIGSGTANAVNVATVASGFDDGEFHSVDITQNGTNDFTILVDGVDQSGGSSSGYRLTNEVAIGWSSTNLPFKGNIGNIKVYNSDSKLIHSWHGDEGSGTTSFDSVQEWNESELNLGANNFIPWGTAGWTQYNNIVGGIELESNTTAGSYTGKDLDMTCGEADNKFFRVQAKVVVDSIDTGYINVYLGSSNGGFNETNNYYQITTTGTFYVDKVMEKNFYINSHSTSFLEFSTSTASTTTAEYTISDISVTEVHPPSHGTIENADLATFHTEDRAFKSYQNEIGYMEEVPQEELVANGDFGEGITSWTNNFAPNAYETFEVQNGKLHVKSDGVHDGYAGTNDTLSVIAGKKYRLSYDYNVTSGVAGKIRLRQSVQMGTEYLLETNVTGSGTFTGEFTALATENITFGFYNHVAGEFWLDNISLRELTAADQLIPRAFNEDGNPLLTDIFGNYMDGSRRAAMNDSELYLETPVAAFDGVNDYVHLGALEALEQNYFKTKIKVSDFSTTLSLFDAASWNSYGFRIYIDTARKVHIQLMRDGGTETIGFAQSIKDNDWSEIEIIIDEVNKNLIMIIDGVTEEKSYVNAYVNQPYSSTRIGILGGVPYFKGEMTYLKYNNHEYYFSEGGGETVYDRVPAYYGENVVTNGDFDTDSDWGKETGWAINGGKVIATAVQTYARIAQSAPADFFKEGSTYRVTINVSTLNSGKFSFYLAGSGLPTEAENNISTIGKHVFIKTLNTVVSQSFAIRGYPDVDGSIESVSIEELHEPVHGTIKNADLDTFWANDDTSRSDNLLDGFTEGLYCKTAGTNYIESTQAYGTWEFDIYRGTDTNIAHMFISSENLLTTDGYRISLYNTGFPDSIGLVRQTGAGADAQFISENGYIENDTPYRLKITRNSYVDEFVTGAIGTFAVYIKGRDSYPLTGDEWELVDSSVDGTNPITDNTHTTSTYFVNDFDSGDRMAGLKMNGQNVRLFNFTDGTGVYSKVNIPAQSGNTGKDVFGNLLAQPTTVNSVVNRLRLSALNLVTVGRRYWDSSYKKFFRGKTSTEFEDFPASDYVVPQETITTLDTNKTAVPDRLYYDTTERKFKKGASDGTVIDY